MVNTQEVEVLGYFKELDDQRGMYDGVRDYVSLSPMELLNDMFLKRLDGHYIDLSIITPQLSDIGDLYIKYPNKLDMGELHESGWITDISFISEKNPKITGVVKVDWQVRLITVIPDEISRSNYSLEDAYIFHVQQYLIHSVTTGGDIDHTLRIGLSPILIPFYEDRVLTYDDIPLNKIDIEMGVIAQTKEGRGYFPEYSTTFKEISDVTGVPASTLSNINSGKTKIENLTYNTLAVLTAYGHIKNLEGMMYQMMIDQLRSDFKIESKSHCVNITMKDGRDLIIDAATHDTSIMIYDAIVEQYNVEDGQGLTLGFVYVDEHTMYERYMVNKEDVDHIRIGSYFTDVHKCQ